MNAALLIIGVVCIAAASVGAGLKLMGNEMPLLQSPVRQMLLGSLGVVVLIGNYVTARTATTERPHPPPTDSTTAISPRSSERIPTKADFVARAAAICQSSGEKARAIPTPDPGDFTAMANVLDRAARITTDLMRQFRRVPLPPGDKATIQAMFAEVDALGSAVAAAASAMRAGDSRQAATLLDQAQGHERAYEVAAKAYGLRGCLDI